ncbi:tetratricopeptide repeat protein [Pseudoalteromonas tunicata]|uniref:tetratricopeptide repeat protein n=1 Tax=Pseudoalteromonas tunicata TaxID=314281 RepID=UPI00273EEEAC|nr:tetratricopeptide repeat protein [Pseudoalteromonas tunicata]MDP4983842.1 tetratricopeptide repeat protein [Pseudoalteromonas tunicata]
MKLTALLLFLSISNSEIFHDLTQAEQSAADNPTQTLVLYQQYQSYLETMPVNVQLKWHKAAARAALRQSDVVGAEKIFIAMLPSYLQAGKNQQDYFYNLVGIWFRKAAFNQQALNAYQCALSNQTTDLDKLKYLNNAAIAARHLNQFELSIKLTEQALAIIKTSPSKPYEGAINNTLGMTALLQQNYEGAKEAFQRSLFLREGLKRTSAQLTSTLNLMTTYLLNHELDAFKRLDKRKLSEVELSFEQQVYLSWLNFLYQQSLYRTAATPSTALVQDYLALRDESIIALVKLMSRELHFVLPDHPVNQKTNLIYQGPLENYLNGCAFLSAEKKQ